VPPQLARVCCHCHCCSPPISQLVCKGEGKGGECSTPLEGSRGGCTVQEGGTRGGHTEEQEGPPVPPACMQKEGMHGRGGGWCSPGKRGHTVPPALPGLHIEGAGAVLTEQAVMRAHCPSYNLSCPQREGWQRVVCGVWHTEQGHAGGSGCMWVECVPAAIPPTFAAPCHYCAQPFAQKWSCIPPPSSCAPAHGDWGEGGGRIGCGKGGRGAFWCMCHPTCKAGGRDHLLGPHNGGEVLLPLDTAPPTWFMCCPQGVHGPHSHDPFVRAWG
jgi:hypothetical protein